MTGEKTFYETVIFQPFVLRGFRLEKRLLLCFGDYGERQNKVVITRSPPQADGCEAEPKQTDEVIAMNEVVARPSRSILRDSGLAQTRSLATL